MANMGSTGTVNISKAMMDAAVQAISDYQTAITGLNGRLQAEVDTPSLISQLMLFLTNTPFFVRIYIFSWRSGLMAKRYPARLLPRLPHTLRRTEVSFFRRRDTNTTILHHNHENVNRNFA